MREAHKILLDSLKPKGKVIFFQAPTGYGKTSFTPTLYRRMRNIGGPPALIHVLPLRAIVEQAYNYFKNTMKDVIVGVQTHGVIEGKSPYFSSLLTVTTFDSFILNLIGANVAEKSLGHYLVPKAMIASSTIVLDEVHLPLYSGDNYYATSILAGVYTLALWKNPVVIETATLPSQIINSIIEQLTPSLIEVEVIEPVPKDFKKYKNNYNIKVKVNRVLDPAYYKEAETVNWHYKRLQEEDRVSKVLQLVQTGRSVFRAVDNVARAINEYDRLTSTLGEDNVALLHSRLTPMDRRKQLEKVEKGVKVLVGTSAVEAGINVSYDVLVTDVSWGGGASLSLLQRMGRINRNNKSPKSTIYLLGNHSSKSDEIIDYLVNVKPNPRIPYDTTRTKGYKEFLDKYSDPDKIRPDFWYTITNLTQRSFKPYEVEKGLKSISHEACGIIRGNLLVPIMPNPSDIGLSTEQLMQDPFGYIFPIDNRLLPQIIWRNNERTKALIVETEKSRDHPYKMSFSIRDVNLPKPGCRGIMAHMLRHGIVAYILSPGIYKPERGLCTRNTRSGSSNAG